MEAILILLFVIGYLSITLEHPLKLDKKDYSELTEKTKPKTMEEIEANLWKNNIKKGPRRKKDFLDIRNEDFSENKTTDFTGKEIVPSSFNIL